MPVPGSIHHEALIAMQHLMLREAQRAQPLAWGRGVRKAEAELDVFGLDDPRARGFVAEFEYSSIKSLTARESQELRVVMSDALRQGHGVEDSLRAVRAATGASESRVRTIARTEMNRAGNWSQMAAWKESGLVQTKEYVATIDDRVAEDHLAADGERVPIDATFTRGAAAGFQAPPIRANCRCTIAPVTRFSGEERGPRAKPGGTSLAGATHPTTLVDQPGHVCLGAVTRAVPGLLKVEREHEARLVHIWRRWASVYAAALHRVPVVELAFAGRLGAALA